MASIDLANFCLNSEVCANFPDSGAEDLPGYWSGLLVGSDVGRHLDLVLRQGAYRQGVDIGFHHRSQGRVYGPMALHAPHLLE